MAFMAAAIPYVISAVSAYTAYQGVQETKKANAEQSRIANEQLQMQKDAIAAAKGPNMPGIDDAAAQAAKRRSVSEQILRRGRASTVMTEPSSSLGGGQSLGG